MQRCLTTGLSSNLLDMKMCVTLCLLFLFYFSFKKIEDLVPGDGHISFKCFLPIFFFFPWEWIITVNFWKLSYQFFLNLTRAEEQKVRGGQLRFVHNSVLDLCLFRIILRPSFSSFLRYKNPPLSYDSFTSSFHSLLTVEF